MVFHVLQGKIFLFIFAEVQGLRLRGNPLEGVIAEFPAVVADRDDSLFRAEHHILIPLRTEAAVQAAALQLFPKQHSDPFLSSHIIHHPGGNFHCYFCEKEGWAQKKRGYTCAQIQKCEGCCDDCVGSLLGDALPHPDSGGYTADLQEPTDPAEGGEKGA